MNRIAAATPFALVIALFGYGVSAQDAPPAPVPAPVLAFLQDPARFIADAPAEEPAAGTKPAAPDAIKPAKKDGGE